MLIFVKLVFFLSNLFTFFLNEAPKYLKCCQKWLIFLWSLKIYPSTKLVINILFTIKYA